MADFTAPIAPDRSFVVIGDVHGCDDLLVQLLDQLSKRVPDLPYVCVGDYVDRGPDSAAVLRRLMTMTANDPESMICLKGNHEAMMLDFIDMPIECGPVWLANGGDKTLESFGISAPSDRRDAPALISARDALVENAEPELVYWLRALPLIWQNGNVAVTHAGGDPSRPLEPRRGHGLLWGHPDFLRKQRGDGLWMTHGHFIVPQPEVTGGRIAIDTGAFSTGMLSAAIIRPGNVDFLST
ncbi:metallophosphoesterase [Roseovarius aestuarii]|uniref:Serine/threonine-protein phosphatase 2 n=2 Tax=Roseovarius aestuarii TaxID=475083 RepID=A0A1X7BQX8_9RHOB|nr:metallophosphoesterase [Roseovarius aestuarii]SMC12086.1 Serine/threonine-protein phosphatase 2 [Roseovarius aestuarii]